MDFIFESFCITNVQNSEKNFIQAVSSNDTEKVKELGKAGDFIDSKDVNGNTALHNAAEAGFKDMIDVLLQLEHKPNVNWKGLGGKTPIMVALEGWHVEIAQQLMKLPGFDYNIKNAAGETTFHVAAKRKVFNTIEHMMNEAFKIKGMSAKEQLPRTVKRPSCKRLMCELPIHQMIERNDTATLKHTLLKLAPEQAKYDLNAKNVDGLTAGQVAIIFGRHDALNLLLKFHGGFIDFSKTTDQGDTYFHLAAEQGSPSVIQLLLTTKAVKHLSEMDKFGRTPVACSENLSVKKLLTPDTSVFDNKIKTLENYRRVRDYLFDSEQKHDILRSRRLNLWKSQMKPLLKLQGDLKLDKNNRKTLKLLLDQSLHFGNSNPRAAYQSDFQETLKNAIEKLWEALAEFQTSISNHERGSALIDQMDKFAYHNNATEETLHQFMPEALGTDVLQNLVKALNDDYEMIQVMAESGCLSDVSSWIKLLALGDHEVVKMKEDYFGNLNFREKLPTLYLAHMGHQLNPYFQEAVKVAVTKSVQGSNIFFTPGPVKSFADIMKKTSRYIASGGHAEGAHIFSCQSVLDMMRCAITVEKVEQMISLINAFKSFKLEKDKLEVKRSKNLHHWLGDAHSTNLRYVQYNCVFKHDDKALIGEIRIYFHTVLEIKKGLNALRPYT